ncbi:MAG: acetyltransferase [Elusimicrobia bacterium]|nr:acetyltransferase [Candidatus Obscuribacterium magneticum]
MSSTTSKIPLAIVSGDKEIIELANECGGYDVVGVFDPDAQADLHGTKALGPDSEWEKVRKANPALKVALALDPTALKEKAARHFGLESLATLVSPEAYVSPTAEVGNGCLLQRGVKIMAKARVGRGCKINVNAVVHHDCVVGDFCTLAPGSQLLGTVKLETRVYVGAGAIILPKIHVGEGAVIGAGAVVVRDVPSGITVVGVPARELVRESDMSLRAKR